MIVFSRDFPLRQDMMDWPVSVNEKGEIATVGDWIDQEAPANIKAMFNRAANPKPQSRVKAVHELNGAELQKITLDILNAGDDDILADGPQSYTKAQRIAEVQNNTAVGKRLLQATAGAFGDMQTAIRTGKVRQVPSPTGSV